MTLHCISADPAGVLSETLDQSIANEDAVLLLDNAADLAPFRQALLDAWVKRGVALYALSNTTGQALRASNIRLISYTEWVQLSEEHSTQRLWR